MNIAAVSARGTRRSSVSRRISVVFGIAVGLVVPAAAAAETPVAQDTIVGGTPAASVADFPHIAALSLSDGAGGAGQCGGSLISPTWIMTAAHCFFDETGAQTTTEASQIAATLNTLVDDPPDAGAEVRSSDRLIIHPGYDPAGDDNDIALFRITEPSAMTPTKLGSPDNVSLWSPGDIATAKGWGTTSSGGPASNELLQVELPIVSDADCNASAAGPITDALMICAGDLANGGIDACQGDSGGPLSVPDPAGGWVTVGVVSFGVGCGDANSPGVYAEVAAFGTWIAQNVPDLGDPGPGAGPGYTAVGPDRAADTRADGLGIPGAGDTVTIPVGSQYAGQSISVNLTITGATARGFATLYACDQDRPDTSSLNYQTGQPIANGVITKVSAQGEVCVYVNRSAHIILDIFGVFPSEASFTPEGPDRAADTRADGLGIPGAGDTVTIPVGSQYAGQSISVNLTITGATARGFATLYACDQDRPDTSSLNYQTGQPIANGVITKVSAQGEVCVYVNRSAHIILDIFGVFPSEASFTPEGPDRAADTRADGLGIPGAGDTVTIPVGSQYAGQSISVNLTITGATARGFATLYACDQDRPDTSSLNYQTGQPIANGVITKVSAQGEVCVYVNRSAHIILDIFGVFPTRCEGFPIVRDFKLAPDGSFLTEVISYRGGETITVIVSSPDTDIGLSVVDRGGGLDSMFEIDDVVGIGAEQYGPYEAPSTGSSLIAVNVNDQAERASLKVTCS